MLFSMTQTHTVKLRIVLNHELVEPLFSTEHLQLVDGKQIAPLKERGAALVRFAKGEILIDP